MSDQHPEKTESRVAVGMLRRIIPKLVIVLVAVGAVAGIMKMPAREQQAAPTDIPLVNVDVWTVQNEAELADTFVLPGVVEPNRLVTVSAEVAGRIEQLPLKEGRLVEKDEMLVQLNRDLIEPELAIAKAQVERDVIQFARMRDLVDRKATSTQDLDDANTQLAISKARLTEIEARRNRTEIVSPAVGVLNELYVEQGEYVQPGTPVAQVVDTKTVKVMVDVPEQDILYFERGQAVKVVFSVKGTPTAFQGLITYINQVANVQTRSTRVEIRIPNKDNLLRSGQIVSVHLTRRIFKDAIMIPLLAVIPMEEGKVVFVEQGGQAKRLDVELGMIRGDRVLVTQGLSAQDRLIVAGHRFVAPDQTVNVVSEK